MRAQILSVTVATLLGVSTVLAQAPAGSPAPGPRPQTPPRDGNQNQTPTGTAKLRGRVIAAQTGTPLRGALIRINATEPRVMQVAHTDEDGRYEVIDLPAARYTISVSKGGYVMLQYGQQRPFERGKQLDLADAQILEKIDFALPRGSVITGRIRDRFGDPVAGVEVRALRYQYFPGGRRQLIPVSNSIGFPNPTDDLGQYRVYGLMPGTYVLSAGTSPSGSTMIMSANGGMTSVNANEGYAATYYPGTATAEDAQAITVALGQETIADMTLISAHLSKVSGFVRNSEGHAVAGANVMLRTAGSMGVMATPSFARAASDGSFTLANVSPGDLIIDVRPGPVEQEFASVPVTVSGEDISGLIITTNSGITIAGHVVFDGPSAHPYASLPGTSSLRVLPTPAYPEQGAMMFTGPDSGVVDDAGNFKISGVSGKVVFRPTSLPPGWSLKSVKLAGRDIIDVPLEVTTNTTGLEITLTDRRASFSGVVRNSRGEPVKDFVVVLLPRNLREGVLPNRFINNLRPDQDGRFMLRAIVPGDYVATAVTSLDSGDEWDPAVQQHLRDQAKPFIVNEGQAITLDLILLE